MFHAMRNPKLPPIRNAGAPMKAPRGGAVGITRPTVVSISEPQPSTAPAGSPTIVPVTIPMIRTERKSLKTQVVVISDIHLGSEVCRARELRRALAEWYPFSRLIILGDLFDDMNFSRLKKHHFGLIDDFRRLTKPSRGVRVDWIEGNHDEQAHDVIHRIIGANVHDELIVELRGVKYLFMHGHQFDDFLHDHPMISEIAGNIYEAVQRREGEDRSISRWLKRKSKGWMSVCRKVEEKALRHAVGRGAQYILCGHTHYHNPKCKIEGLAAEYVNTGCWTDTPSTLTTIGGEGLRKHLYY
jgi:UDP-2,3-diacylglucosamine pyrophosphatase LpxH